MKTRISSNTIPQSHVIEHQLRDNPIYARSTAPPHEPSHLDNCNSLHPHYHHQHHHHNLQQQQQQQQQPVHHHHTATAAHSYEKLDHVIINPTNSSANAAYNLLTTPAAVTSPDVVNTMGYLVASPPPRDPQLARPIIIWAPRSRDAANGNMAELNVVTDQHGRPQCCCTSASGLPSTATSGGGYMECDARTRSHAVGGEESRERYHVTGGAEPGWVPRDQNTSHRCNRNGGQYTAMSHNRLNDWNISAL